MGILDLCEPLKCYRFCCMTALRTADLTLQSLLDELKHIAQNGIGHLSLHYYLHRRNHFT